MIDRLAHLRSVTASRHDYRRLHAQILAGSMDSVARSRALLTVTKAQLERPGRPDQPWPVDFQTDPLRP